MATRDKRIEAMQRNPRTVTMDDLRAALESQGFAVRSHGTSHVVFTHPLLRANLSIPTHRPFVRAVYVRQALRAIADVEAAEAAAQAMRDEAEKGEDA